MATQRALELASKILGASVIVGAAEGGDMELVPGSGDRRAFGAEYSEIGGKIVKKMQEDAVKVLQKYNIHPYAQNWADALEYAEKHLARVRSSKRL